MIGFRFRNIHSKSFGIGVRSEDRTLIPQRVQPRYSIPGRDGSIGYGFGDYQDRVIKMRLGLVKNTSWDQLRQKAREIAYWLSGSGELIFDDEPNKSYEAGVYEPVSLEQIQLLAIGEASVSFLCKPFARTLAFIQLTEVFKNKPHQTALQVQGTQETPCILIIRNIGSVPVSHITITRKAGS